MTSHNKFKQGYCYSYIKCNYDNENPHYFYVADIVTDTNILFPVKVVYCDGSVNRWCMEFSYETVKELGPKTDFPEYWL